MRIKGHKLVDAAGNPVPFKRSPNQSAPIVPRYLVMHYTASISARGTVNWFADPASKVSAHLVIGRDGSVTQMVAFNRKAWHAGPSRWDGISNLNSHSIGIELVNAGPLTQSGDTWVTAFGREVPEDQVIFARHKNEDEERAWHSYSTEQLEAALQIATALCRHYGLREVVGHDDIAPSRKTDPGPAFPMASFAAAAAGREEDDPASHRTTATLNIRTGPGTEYDKLPASPLPSGTRLEMQGRHGNWAQVFVMDPIGDDMDIEGWVHTGYIGRL